MRRQVGFIVLAALGALLTSLRATAQSINIDLGFPGDAPAAKFAAAGQAGTWNDVSFTPVQVALVDLAGAATAARIDYQGNVNGLSFDNPATAGDHEKLLDDVLDLGLAPSASSYTIGPLSGGVYDVYVYAMSPSTATDKTSVSIQGGAAQICSGAFAGYALGATHLSARVWLGANESIRIDAASVLGGGNGSVAGLQLVKNPAGVKLARKLNIDVGTQPRPTNDYGAAAGQAGVWNPSAGAGVTLSDLNGAATDARIAAAGFTLHGSFDHAATNGNDEALMDDWRDVGLQGAMLRWSIGPMAKGTYDVYVYAWDSAGSGDKTEVKVVGGAGAAAQVCGVANWPGLVVNQTYVVERVTLAASGNIEVDTKSLQGHGVVNGFQVVEVPQAGACRPGASGGVIPASGSGGGSAWPIALPPSPMISTANITPPPGATRILRVRLHALDHTYIADLQVVLEAPDSTRYNLICRPGVGSGNSCFGDLHGDYTIRESWGASLASVCSASPVASGDFVQDFGVWPSGTAGVFNVPLESIPIAAGTWRLLVFDWAGGDTGSLVDWELCFDEGANATFNACQLQPTVTQGCVSIASLSGTPSATSLEPFTLAFGGLNAQVNAVAFYGVSGPASATWSPQSLMCVKAPTQRLNGVSGAFGDTGGSQGSCDGALEFDMNGVLRATGFLGTPMSAGQRVDVQTWQRDPAAPSTTNLTDALTFFVGP